MMNEKVECTLDLHKLFNWPLGSPLPHCERFEFLGDDHILLGEFSGTSFVVSATSGEVDWTGNLWCGESSANGRYLVAWPHGHMQIVDRTDGSDRAKDMLAKVENLFVAVSGDGGTVLAVRNRHVAPPPFDA